MLQVTTSHGVRHQPLSGHEIHHQPHHHRFRMAPDSPSRFPYRCASLAEVHLPLQPLQWHPCRISTLAGTCCSQCWADLKRMRLTLRSWVHPSLPITPQPSPGGLPYWNQSHPHDQPNAITQPPHHQHHGRPPINFRRIWGVVSGPMRPKPSDSKEH